MTPAQVKSALDIYSGGKLPPGEYYISESEPYTIAFLYGEEPQLYITRNGGSTWESYPIPLGTSLSGLGYSGRAVRFLMNKMAMRPSEQVGLWGVADSGCGV